MAKVQYCAAIPDGGPPWTTPFVPDFKIDTHSGDFADFVPESTGDNVTVTFRGTGFVYDGNSDFVDGTVKSLTFTSGNDVLARISGLKLSAADAQATMEEGPILLFIEVMQGNNRIKGSDDADRMDGLGGDDIMFGYGGNDVLVGGFGRNTLTGGKGSDRFDCGATDGDTITDFDAFGGVGKQDFLDINGFAYEKERSGKDTLITFDGGDILLLGVKPRDIDASDFMNM